ncbi:hypothetical protein ACJX0J_038573, partial [Zea mays]
MDMVKITSIYELLVYFVMFYDLTLYVLSYNCVFDISKIDIVPVFGDIILISFLQRTLYERKHNNNNSKMLSSFNLLTFTGNALLGRALMYISEK